MKYLSEKTNKAYSSLEDLKAAEKEYDVKQAEVEKKNKDRQKRAKEIEDAYKAIVDAKQHYNKLLESFVKDYGSCHYSITSTNPDSGFIFPDLNLDLIDKLFNAIFQIK